MKFTLLGTSGSAGLPQIGGPDGRGDWGRTDPNEPRNRRTRTSIVVQTAENKNILVDTSPDLRMQLTSCGIGRIDAVIYTHAHADHVAGIDEVRILNRIMDAPMPCYGTEALWEELKRRFGYAFKPHNGGFFGRPVLHDHIVAPGEAFEVLGTAILPLDQDHGYSRSLGLRLGNAAYCTDVVRFDDTAFATLQGLDLFIVDCFTPAQDHPTHAGLPTVLSWVERLKPKRTVLTHLGPDMDYRTLCNTLPSGIEPGYDGMVLEV
ncbi:MBL fold metallo-hydrolase [Acidocella aromatica]|uniref:Phosphoribosyl 1,2-cyclic phosphate phosphodiesterase n=1 Tax=Acidocella aromatica TaxID=1303579 RepID=A0A840V8U9_9PROT|nr:MBL fold metallo-hydrolase [Acidocella aromatica]MBB5372388.1 phosphoribosyl 1,2-cyclic phosphate phosphodiesterase [Acidocella aromatica]